MGYDVSTKIISTKVIRNGDCVVGVSNVGSISGMVLHRYDAVQPVPDNLYNKYDDRFDDPRYYEGDTSS